MSKIKLSFVYILVVLFTTIILTSCTKQEVSIDLNTSSTVVTDTNVFKSTSIKPKYTFPYVFKYTVTDVAWYKKYAFCRGCINFEFDETRYKLYHDNKPTYVKISIYDIDMHYGPKTAPNFEMKIFEYSSFCRDAEFINYPKMSFYIVDGYYNNNHRYKAEVSIAWYSGQPWIKLQPTIFRVLPKQ